MKPQKAGKKKPRKPVPASAVVGHGNFKGKPMIFRDAKSIVTPNLEFQEKKLCDGLTMNPGDACVYNCEYCYVPSSMLKLTSDHIEKFNDLHPGNPKKCGFRDLVIRRRKSDQEDSLSLLKEQLDRGLARANEHLVVFGSTLVDVAANVTLLNETAAVCTMILERTRWDLRLLSKSPLLAHLVSKNLIPKKHHQRLIFGFSAGTLDDQTAKAIERGTPLVSKRLEALHWLQDHNYRTYGMICPSLPQTDYSATARALCAAIRGDKCEHVWAEVINPRGDSLSRTALALEGAQFHNHAAAVKAVTGAENRDAWEVYARNTFLALKDIVPGEKLRYLQYVSEKSRSWWETHRDSGAVLLGEAVKNPQPTSLPKADFRLMETTPTIEKPMTYDERMTKMVQNVRAEEAAKIAAAAQDELTIEQLELRLKLEKTVTKGVRASLEAANALFEIYDHDHGVLWRGGYANFAAYCRAKWGYEKAHAYRLRRCGEVLDSLDKYAKQRKTMQKDTQSPNGDWFPFPKNEGQIRPFVELKVPKDKRGEVWEAVITDVKPSDLTGEIVTEKVRKIAYERKIKISPEKEASSETQRVEKLLKHLAKIVQPSPSAKKIEVLIEKIRVLLS